MTLVKTFLIMAKTPKGSAWTYSEDGMWGCSQYEDEDLARAICARLNRLEAKLEWSYEVVERKAKAA